MTISRIIDLMIEQPVGWIRASLPKIEIATCSVANLTHNAGLLHEAREACLCRRWRDLTEIDVEATHFSVVVPVHNEERSLPSMLGALLASELPSSADIQFIFVVNASNDKSVVQIKNRLALICSPTETHLPASDYDSRMKESAFQVCCGRIRFLVIETPTAGKANALNLGNEIALRQDHNIAINIDANNWVEPDSIALIYQCAKQAGIDSPNNKVVLVNALEYCPTRNEQAQVAVKGKTQKAEISGSMFAWSTRWIQQNGGFPQLAIEDYGTGLLALSQRKRIIESSANIWAFSPADDADEKKQLIRFVYGALQLKRLFRDDQRVTNILMDDFPHLRPWRKRLDYYVLSRVRERKPLLKILRGFYTWLANENCIFEARRLLRRNPSGQTWQPIRSTK